MAHNYDVFDGHAYFAEDGLDLQQCNGNLFFSSFFWLKMLSQVVFAGQNGIGLHSLQPHFPYPIQSSAQGVGVYCEMRCTCPIVHRLKACTHCNSSNTGTVTPYSNIQKLVYGFAASKCKASFTHVMTCHDAFQYLYVILMFLKRQPINRAASDPARILC